MKFYYGFEYFDWECTTTGNPHPKTGRYDIAGTLKAFTTKEEREEWFETIDPDNYKRKRRLNKKEIRGHFEGHSVEEMNQVIEEVNEEALDHA